ncbi:PAS domain S-box-containing protein [Ochrobactrum sp. 19YEA23]|uniref:PAS domain S-box protein n=1 Tax=Ochrobactrum sp. 19YEA23 TaxID=3039854 RepID=UPI0024787311|nr:PAS domain S-box-containing protein [Ochrobactrum sp. 19YEA23]
MEKDKDQIGSNRLGSAYAKHRILLSVTPASQPQLGETDLDPRDWLAAIVDGSDDAIVSKDLNGIIRSWNRGAERLFGYHAEEVIGKPVTILIPEDRLDEEPAILSEIRKGNRVDHFETVRKRRDGTLIDISLTISPIRNTNGVIIGASKIARDISERLEAQSQQKLHMGEMRHRVKNLFALANGIVSLSARSATQVDEFREVVQARLAALARAHELTMPTWDDADVTISSVPLQNLLHTILEPYGENNFHITGHDPAVTGKSLTNLSLLLHELTTNAAKHGALASSERELSIDIQESSDTIFIYWLETGNEYHDDQPSEGFGTRLERALVSALNADFDRLWVKNTLKISISLPKALPE